MPVITSAEFEDRYGAVVRPEYSGYIGREALRTVLGQRQPPIVVSGGVLRQWLNKSSKPPGAVTVSSTVELQDKYGAVVKLLAGKHAAAYLLC